MKKTQAFLVIGFIVAVALAIGFYMQKEDEKNSRIHNSFDRYTGYFRFENFRHSY